MHHTNVMYALKDFEFFSCSTSCSNWTFNSSIKSDFASHTKSQNLGHRTHGLNGQFLKNKLVKILCLKVASIKCCENYSNWKNMFCFNLASWDAQDLACQHCKYKKFMIFHVPPNQSTFATICLNWILMIPI
jgi:hypothetical protein